ncbi:MAG: glycosyltransferase [Polyangiales bacterium]
MTNDIQSQQGVGLLSADVVAWFRDTVFILGPFPALSQTFIYREFDAMRALGLPVNILSTGRRQPEATHMTEALREIERGALHLEHNSPRIICSMGARLSSRDVRETMRWMMGLPHRTAAQRARAAAAVLVAAHFAPDLARRGIRYVHSHFAGFQTEVAMSLSRLLDVPYGCTWHAYGIYRDRNILEEKVAGARVVLSCTRHNVEHLRRLRPSDQDRIHLAYHGLDLTQIPEAPPIRHEATPAILAIGRIVAKKGFPHLVRAAGLLKERGRRFELRFLGDGPDRPVLEALARQLGLHAEIVFLGARPNAEVFREIAAARVIAVPSVITPEGGHGWAAQRDPRGHEHGTASRWE